MTKSEQFDARAISSVDDAQISVSAAQVQTALEGVPSPSSESPGHVPPRRCIVNDLQLVPYFLDRGAVDLLRREGFFKRRKILKYIRRTEGPILSALMQLLCKPSFDVAIRR